MKNTGNDMRNETFIKKLGEKIVQLRKEKGISQLELANRLDTHNNQIRRIEVGEGNPTINTLLDIAKELGVSVNDLVNIK